MKNYWLYTVNMKTIFLINENGSGVYKITNLLNGRIYIGSAINLRIRRNGHINLLRTNKHDNQFLQNDFNKCSEESFIFEVILETNQKDLLLFFEQSYLDEYYDEQKQCYNILPKAGNMLGRKCSEETKRKIVLSLIGKPAHNKGKKLTDEQKAKLRIAFAKRKKPTLTKEYREKLRSKMMGNSLALGNKYIIPDEIKKRRKKQHMSQSQKEHMSLLVSKRKRNKFGVFYK